MSFSCAPILFDSYACASDIADGGKCGILVKPFDDKTFAKKIVRLATNDEERGMLGYRAFNKSLRFSTESTVNQWMELFNELTLKKW